MSDPTRSCISCGMPLRTPADHCGGDPAKPFCRHCGDSDGQLKSREAVLEGLTDFLVRTQGIDPQVARSTANAMMAQLPAWRDQ